MSIGPWFKCYPADWLEGIRDLSMPAQGAYAHLVMRMYDGADAIRADDRRIGRWLNSNKAGWVKVRKELIAEGKLVELADGSLINVRCLREMANQCKSSKQVPPFIRTRIEKLCDLFSETYPKLIQNNRETSPETRLKTTPLKEARIQKPESSSKDDGALFEKETLAIPKKRKTKAPRSRGTRIAQFTALGPKDYAYATSKGMTPGDIQNEFEQFRNRHAEKGTISHDWPASWRTWVGNWQKWRKPNTANVRGANQAGSGQFEAFANELDEYAGGREPRREDVSADSSVFTLDLEAVAGGR